MQQAMNETSDNKYARTFYTYRNVPSLDFLYAAMRIVFTAILGILISSAMLFATGKGEDDQLILLTSVITGVLAGIILEIGINLFYIPPIIIRYLYFILIALTFITLKAFGGNGRGRQYVDPEDIYSSAGTRRTMGESKGIGNNSTVGSGSGYNDSNDEFFG